MCKDTQLPGMVIGLEVHLQVQDDVKLFSGEGQGLNSLPNEQVSPLSLGLPGALPVLNSRVVRRALAMARRMGGTIARYLAFDRKHYTYPDLPKGYQITQKRFPLCVGGGFRYYSGERERWASLQQIHLEEDAGKTQYQDHALHLDYNRAGIPLIEFVTQPCFTHSQEVVDFLQQLQLWVRKGKISFAKMEQGQMRCDVNVSLSGHTGRCEVKNMNSFYELRKAMGLLIQYLQEAPKAWLGHTLAYHSREKQLKRIRLKEKPTHYRYLPEYDIPVIPIENFYTQEVSQMSSVLFPADEIDWFCRTHHLAPDDAWFLLYNSWAEEFFRALVPPLSGQSVIHLLKGPFAALWKDLSDKPTCSQNLIEQLVTLMQMIEKEEISRDVAYGQVLPLMLHHKLHAVRPFVRQRGWLLNNNRLELSLVIDKVLEKYPKEYKRLLSGENQLIGFFIGRVRADYGEGANPKLIQTLLYEKRKEE
ncbi:MAG: Asp-tRNA(Asn)/Glu-tRNA(Gln) amidotransferase subunit GatB [Bacteroidales bacterium]